MLTRRSLLATSAAGLAMPAIARAAATRLSFYYPIAVGGPIPAIIDGYCQAFHKETGIEVTPVYAGNYGETATKAVTAIKGGSGPQLAVLLAAEMHALQDLDILVSLDELGAMDAAGKAWVAGFYPAFMANSVVDGKTWSVPFQRSTAVMYYNKDAFKQAGLDPEHFPRTWAELGAAAAKLTQRNGSQVTRWGVKMASDVGNAQWTFGAIANQASQKLMNQAGTETYFNTPKAIEGMEYWRGLSATHHATPPGVSTWSQLSPDFLQGNTAIIQHTTGNLTNLRTNAKFPFGVAGLPGKTGPATVVGGGNIYFFKHASAEERAAAVKFARFLTQPERAADWSIKTGYIGTRPDAYETKLMQSYIASYPPADVARSFLPVATGELSTFQNQRVYSALTDNIQACLDGKKTAAQAMADTQTAAVRLLKPYRA